MTDDTEPLLIQPLPNFQASSDGSYTFVDRYRDCNAVFGTEPGKRVLAQLLHLCEGYIPGEDQPHSVMAGYCSRMRLAAQLKRWIMVPPRSDKQP